MGKPIPYMIRRSTVVRCKTGFDGSCDTGLMQYAYPQLRQCAS